MLVTVFLVVLIIALAFGNILLSLLKPPMPEQPHPSTVENSTLENPRQGVFKANPAFELAADKERIQMLNKRIDRLESMLLKINGAKFLGKKLNGTVLGQRLNEFSEFKGNTKLEIAALKQELAALKSKLGVQGKKSKTDYAISNKKLHNLVFQGGSGKAKS